MHKTSADYVSDELYSRITSAFPIVCVDVIPFDAATNKIGVITRATGSETGRLSLIGGRINKNESIEEAIGRHLWNDLQIKNFTFFLGNEAARPFYVQQYFHGNAPKGKFKGYDPSKHAIGLTYIISIKEAPIPRAEAGKFCWLNEPDIPDTGAYAQQLIMREAFAFIAKKKDSL